MSTEANSDKENICPGPEKIAHNLENVSIAGKNEAQNKNGLGNENTKNPKNKEAEARIQKAKAKPAADDMERRSVRNKDKNDTHTTDKTEDMARKRNLEVVPGKEPFPTVLNSTPSFISKIAPGIGLSLGNS